MYKLEKCMQTSRTKNWGFFFMDKKRLDTRASLGYTKIQC